MNQEVQITAESVTLAGNVSVPNGASGIVLFAHGSGSSRLSPRNRAVAQALNQAGLATLLFDLLTKEEEIIDQQTLALRFDIPLLAKRLVATTAWLLADEHLSQLNIGYFGSSTGAAAALIAAAELTDVVKAVVSRGGRPDLAGEALPKVKAPTLLIVGGLDETVLELNQQAQAQLTVPAKLEIVSGATHLFEESGKLDEVVRLAINWFKQYLENNKI